MEEEKSYVRLQEELAKALNLSRERIEKWERFKGDYEALQARLCTLPDKLTHDIVVPFGRFGFMPGQLYHSNEVMVLLGDNWFSKRTCKQALEIAERRKQYVVKKLEEERKQLDDWDARMTFTEDMRATRQEHGGVVEIKEDCDTAVVDDREGARKEWRARQPRHKQVPPPRPAFGKPQRHPQSEPSSLPSESDPGSKGIEDEALWDRLDELEKEEAQCLEKESERNEEGRARHESIHDRKMVTQKRGTVDTSLQKKASSTSPLHITIKHSLSSEIAQAPHAEGTGEQEGDDLLLDVIGEEKPYFRTPADIFERYRCLRTSDEGDVEEEMMVGRTVRGEEVGVRRHEKTVRWDPQLENQQPSEERGKVGGKVMEKLAVQSIKAPLAFSEQVIKRSPLKTSPSKAPLAFTGQIVERISPLETSPSKETSRKMSKFKAARRTV